MLKFVTMTKWEVIELAESYGLSDTAIKIYRFLHDWCQIPDKVISDAYSKTKYHITVARSIIAKEVGKCTKTTIKYIKELKASGLIDELRLGYNQVNHMYIEEVSKMKDKYKINSNDKRKEILEQTQKIISPLLREGVQTTVVQLKTILNACDDDLIELKKGVEYTSTKRYKNAYSYLVRTLQDSLYNKIENDDSFNNIKPDLSNPNSELNDISTKGKRKKKSASQSKPNKFNNIYSHNWNFELLEQKEALFIDYKANFITEEQYNQKMKELEEKYKNKI